MRETLFHTRNRKEQALIITHDREKLLNTLAYFINNTSWYGKTKLFKLLYFLDFEHFKETGRSVTGLDYFAWEMGPVPAALQNEIDNPESDFSESFDIDIKPANRGKIIYLIPKIRFDPTHFTRRELRLLRELASRYDLATAGEMVEQTHLETQPWHQVWEVEQRRFERIPYEYALSTEEREYIESITTERLEVINNYS